MLISMPPKFLVGQVIGYMKGKIAIPAFGSMQTATEFFGTRGYWVSTVERDGVVMRRHVQNQEQADQRLNQLTLMPY